MEIKIYTMEGCTFCTKLKKLLNDNNLKYVEFDIHKKENEEMFEKLMEISKCESVPMITINQHLLAPDINFNSIENALEIIKHIINNE